MESPTPSNSKDVLRMEFFCTDENCKYKSYIFRQIQDHRQTHTNSMPYYCKWKKCKKNTTTDKTMKSHILAVHLNVKQKKQKFASKKQNEEACKYIGVNEEIIEQEKQQVIVKNQKKRDFIFQKRQNTSFETMQNVFDDSLHELIDGINFKFVPPKKRLASHNCDFEGCTYSACTITSILKHRRIHTKSKPYYCTFAGCTKSHSGKYEASGHIKCCHLGITQSNHILMTPSERENALKFVGINQDIIDKEMAEYKENISKNCRITIPSDDDDDDKLSDDSNNIADDNDNDIDSDFDPFTAFKKGALKRSTTIFSEDENDDDKLVDDSNKNAEFNGKSSNKHFVDIFSADDENNENDLDFDPCTAYKKLSSKKRRLIINLEDDDDNDKLLFDSNYFADTF